MHANGAGLKTAANAYRIAGDLRDDVGSTLTSISYYSELAKMKLKEEDARLKSFLDKLSNLK